VTKKKRLSEKDKKIWANYIKNPSDIYDKDINNLKNQIQNSRFKYDLHGYSLNEANNKVREIIFYCIKNKYNEILFITGKGLHSKNDNDIYVSKDLGKLKFSVPEFIKSNQEINKYIKSINTAESKDGGEGAIVVVLKNL